jgi:DNA repair protein RecO (recombination protein O)
MPKELDSLLSLCGTIPPMARETQVEGVVLRRWYAGEYDKWVSLFTPDYGKLRLRVRGARKPKSKMGMLTEPMNRLKARVIEGRAQKLLVQPQLARGYVNSRAELERLSIALALCETLDRWLPEEHPEPEVYETLVDALESLECGALPEAVAAQALWRWLALLGYAPELGRCARCGVVSGAEGGSFVIIEGQLLCRRCAPRAEGVPLDATAVARLQNYIQGESLEPSARPEEAQTLLRAGLRYAEDALESPVRWLEFWERLSALRESG